MIDKIKITSREQWLSLREQDVTASVAGVLLGIHPYVTAFELFNLKAGLSTDDPEETPPMQRGRLLEPVAVQLLRENKPDWKIQKYPVGYYFRDPPWRIGATPDVIAINEHGERGIVQIKSVEPSIFRRDWKTEEGTFEPPLSIVVQGVIEAHLTNSKWAAVAPLVVGFGMEMPIIPIPIHVGILDKIRELVKDFWLRVAEGRNYPPDYGRDGAAIAALYPRDTGETIDLSGDNEIPELVSSLESARIDKKVSTTEENEAKAAIALKMGTAAFARLADGRRISFKTQQRAAYIVNESEFRVLKILKG